MPYGDFQDLPWRAASDKVLRDKAFNITKNPKFDRYLRGLVLMASKFFDKKSTLLADESAYGSGVKSEIKQKSANSWSSYIHIVKPK